MTKLKKYFTGLSILVGSSIITYALYYSIREWNLSEVADISQIVIALGAVGSIIFAISTIKESNWSLAMAHVPSLALRPSQIYLLKKYGGVSSRTGDAIEKNNPDDTCTLVIHFKCENLGRGTAFNIKKPEVINATYASYYPTPLYMTARAIEDDSFEFRVLVERSFDDWIENGTKKIPVRVEILYTNDQKNVQCCSWWKADILPFDISGDKLIIRELRILSREAGVDYLRI